MPHDIAGSHEESEPDHGHSETSAGAGGPVPMSEPLSEAGGTAAPATAPATSPIAIPPLPPFPVCIINLKAGCYRITYRPVGFNVFNGTMRVDKSGGTTTISGDLYRFLNLIIPVTPIGPTPLKPQVITAGGASLKTPPTSISIFPILLNIPIYARNKYYSYLKVTNIQTSPIFAPPGQCALTLTAQKAGWIKDRSRWVGFPASSVEPKWKSTRSPAQLRRNRSLQFPAAAPKISGPLTRRLVGMWPSSTIRRMYQYPQASLRRTAGLLPTCMR